MSRKFALIGNIGLVNLLGGGGTKQCFERDVRQLRQPISTRFASGGIQIFDRSLIQELLVKIRGQVQKQTASFAVVCFRETLVGCFEIVCGQSDVSQVV